MLLTCAHYIDDVVTFQKVWHALCGPRRHRQNRCTIVGSVGHLQRISTSALREVDALHEGVVDISDRFTTDTRSILMVLSCISKVRRVTIPNSVTHIDADGFKGFDMLKSVQIPDSVRAIGSNAFDGCASLTCLEISSTTCVKRLAFTKSEKFNNRWGHSNAGCPALTMLLVRPVRFRKRNMRTSPPRTNLKVQYPFTIYISRRLYLFKEVPEVFGCFVSSQC